MQNKDILVIKIGGAILDHPSEIIKLLVAVKNYKRQTQKPVIIIHGGGKLIDELSAKLGIKVNKINGLRVSDTEQMQAVVAGLAGLANKKILGLAHSLNLKAVGLCLGDGLCFQGKIKTPELGFVGKITAKNSQLFDSLLALDFLPIVSSVAFDENGNALNVNADEAALELSDMLKASLIFLSDVAGVLDNNKNLIQKLDKKKVKQLIDDKIIVDGMKIKVEMALKLAEKSQKWVKIAHWQDSDKIDEIITGIHPCSTIFN